MGRTSKKMNQSEEFKFSRPLRNLAVAPPLFHSKRLERLH